MRWRGVSHVEFAVLDYDNLCCRGNGAEDRHRERASRVKRYGGKTRRISPHGFTRRGGFVTRVRRGGVGPRPADHRRR